MHNYEFWDDISKEAKAIKYNINVNEKNKSKVNLFE